MSRAAPAASCRSIIIVSRASPGKAGGSGPPDTRVPPPAPGTAPARAYRPSRTPPPPPSAGRIPTPTPSRTRRTARPGGPSTRSSSRSTGSSSRGGRTSSRRASPPPPRTATRPAPPPGSAPSPRPTPSRPSRLLALGRQPFLLELGVHVHEAQDRPDHRPRDREPGGPAEPAVEGESGPHEEHDAEPKSDAQGDIAIAVPDLPRTPRIGLHQGPNLDPCEIFRKESRQQRPAAYPARCRRILTRAATLCDHRSHSRALRWA